jgi:hypothetical protein
MKVKVNKLSEKQLGEAPTVLENDLIHIINTTGLSLAYYGLGHLLHTFTFIALCNIALALLTNQTTKHSLQLLQ